MFFTDFKVGERFCQQVRQDCTGIPFQHINDFYTWLEMDSNNMHSFLMHPKTAEVMDSIQRYFGSQKTIIAHLHSHAHGEHAHHVNHHQDAESVKHLAPKMVVLRKLHDSMKKIEQDARFVGVYAKLQEQQIRAEVQGLTRRRMDETLRTLLPDLIHVDYEAGSTRHHLSESIDAFKKSIRQYHEAESQLIDIENSLRS
ncbi:MAG: hypothetical protein ABIH34_04160 [Nanoarchaeota archaeon]